MPAQCQATSSHKRSPIRRNNTLTTVI